MAWKSSQQHSMSNVASPTNKDGIMECPLQINMTEIEIQWSFDAHPCSEKGYWMTSWNWTHLLDLRVWNQDKNVIHLTLNHVTGVFWSLSHLVGTEACFYTIKLTVLSLDKNDLTRKWKILMNFRLWNQDKNKLKRDILMFCGLLLVYCHFVGTEKHIFMHFSTNKTTINEVGPRSILLAILPAILLNNQQYCW